MTDAATEAVSVPSFPSYLKSLRVLGAWWCRGSSGVEPQQLLPHRHWNDVELRSDDYAQVPDLATLVS